MSVTIRNLAAIILLACPLRQASGQATDNEILRQANARIERIRKADATVTVRDKHGRPVPNARIRVEQTRHAFLFGCAAITLEKHADTAKEREYQKRFGDLFNFATLLTYWQDTNPAPDRVDLSLLDRQVNRLGAMGITIKGHPLILAGACPKWVPSDPDEARRLTEQRIRGLAARYRGRIQVWDVVGDATTAATAMNGLGAWARKAGSARFTADAFTLAREADPHATLLYNDYKLDGDYTKLVEDMAALGAPLDVLGLEAHMIGSEWPLSKVWSTAETFAALKKPLHFSELTVLSDDPKADHAASWPTTPDGEQRQADYVEKLYTVLFSHPAVRGIGWWNLVDGDWDRIPGGLLRSDLSAKPAYDRLLSLIKGRWWTRAAIAADSKGTARFTGFAGTYRISVESAGVVHTTTATIAAGKPNRIQITIR